MTLSIINAQPYEFENALRGLVKYLMFYNDLTEYDYIIKEHGPCELLSYAYYYLTRKNLATDKRYTDIIETYKVYMREIMENPVYYKIINLNLSHVDIHQAARYHWLQRFWKENPMANAVKLPITADFNKGWTYVKEAIDRYIVKGEKIDG
jgi:hypothetical protein